MIFKEDFHMGEVEDTYEKLVLGQARGGFFSVEFLHEWVKGEWGKELKEILKFSTLTYGWLMLKFHFVKEDSRLIKKT